MTLADWERFPAWEFCLDEEGEPGQTECTLRPCRARQPLTWPDFDGGIACAVKLANGTTHSGVAWIHATEFDADRSSDAELWLNRPARELCSEPLPPGWNQIIYDDARRLTFTIANEQHLPTKHAMELIRLVYKTLGVDAAQMWPIEIVPRVKIRNWPESWKIEGWRRGGSGDVLK